MAKTTIKYSTALFVFLLAAGSFVLSYANLWDNAIAYGVPSHLAWIWPLLIDFALIVFSLAVVWASLDGASTWWPWCLVAFYTVATVAFNAYHAPDNPAAQIVAVVAPVSLFLSFETLMAMLKGEVKKSTLVQGITQIEVELSKKRQELDTLELTRLGKIEEIATVERAELDKAKQELETILRQITQAQDKLSDITGQTEGQKAGQNDKQIPVVIIGDGLDLPKMKPAERQKYLPQLLNGGVDKDKILDIFGISAKTLDRDIKECNGLIMDPADVPFAAGGKNGHKGR